MPDTILYRLGLCEQRMRDLDERTRNVNVMASDLVHLGNTVHELSEEVGALRKAIVTAALSFAGGALLIAFSIFQVLG